MKSKNDIFAFPLPSHPRLAQANLGMTLRDYFAGQALAGLLTQPSVLQNMTDEQVATMSYGCADALLTHRKKDQ